MKDEEQQAAGQGTEAFLRDLEWMERLRAQIDAHAFRRDIARLLYRVPLLTVPVLSGLVVSLSIEVIAAPDQRSGFATGLWLAALLLVFAVAWVVAVGRWLLGPAQQRLDRDRRRLAEATELLRPRIGALEEAEHWSPELAQMVELRFGRLPLDR